MAAHLLQPPAGARGTCGIAPSRASWGTAGLPAALLPCPPAGPDGLEIYSSEKLESFVPSVWLLFLVVLCFVFFFFFLNFKMGVPNLIKDSISWNEHF